MIAALVAATLAATEVAALPAVPPVGASLFSETFQSGSAAGWGATGKGDVRLSTYAGNVSLKLSGEARAVHVAPLAGQPRLDVRMSLAASGLSGDQQCVGEASLDGGQSWRQVVEVGPAGADALTLHKGALSLDAAGAATLTLRFRAPGGKAVCWADDIAVSAGAAAGPVSLDLAVLTGAKSLDAPAAMAAFTPSPRALSPTAVVSGKLRLEASSASGFRVLRDDAPGAAPERRRTLPALAVNLTNDGGALIPAERGPRVSGHPEWDWIVEPGRIWREPGENGWLRATLPVALEERNANCVHNGVLAFAIGPGGQVSKAVLEVASETCSYFKFDLWTQINAAFSPAPPLPGVAEAWRGEVAARLPVRPLSALDVDADALSRAAGPDAVFGLVVDGVNYVAPCPTRQGHDPFCDVHDLPSYSTAKTIFAALAVMRLEALKPGVADETIASHVEACRTSGGWAGVRIIDALDMTTGHYLDPRDQADEGAPATVPFFDSGTSAEKAAFACGHFPRKAAPGAVWAYHTSDTFLVGLALSDIVRRDLGPDKDLFADVVLPIYRTLDLSPTLDVTRRTYDAASQPFSGWGLTYHRDDIIRLARFLQDGGQAGGRRLLDPTLLGQAMQKLEPGGGLRAGYDSLRYRHGVWARDISGLIGCKTAVWTPFMSGFGGISVVMFANDVVFYAFGDDDHFDWAEAAVQANRIRSLCP